VKNVVFSNLVFLFIFLPVVICGYYLVPMALKNLLLLAASLIFYAWGEPVYIVLMLLSISLNFFFGLAVDRQQNSPLQQKFWLTLAISANLLLLGYFKYYYFFIETINAVFHTSLATKELPLPIGISFFTFQALSYVFDVYRKDTEVQKNVFHLALYIALFPQLVAGPIVRYSSIAHQLKNRVHSFEFFSAGIKFFVLGLTRKVLLANPLGELADKIFALNPGNMAVLTAWLGILAYTLQIYFDFSGYSQMAIGLGKMFGFEFPENFNYPYISRSIREFWSRWHITLSHWFRDYVYIPLGGNRVGTLRLCFNLLVVWSITGFWHGASWTFMAWGFYYGVLLVFERLGWGKFLTRLPRILQHLYVLLIVMVGWIFFRADNFVYSFQYLKTMFFAGGTSWADSYALVHLNDYFIYLVAGCIFAFPLLPYFVRTSKKLKNRLLQGARRLFAPLVYMLLFLLNIMFLVNSTYNPFIYFRF